MSVRIPIKHLSREQIQTIQTECLVQGAKSEYTPVPKVIIGYEPVSKDCEMSDGSTQKKIIDVIIPMHFATAKFGKEFIEPFLPDPKSFPRKTFQFNGQLYDKQLSIRDEIVNQLKKYRNAMVNVHCGGGKCMAPDTEILMANGTVQTIDSINVGDQVMGDDGTPRNVTDLAVGLGPLLEIVMADGETIKVTPNHKLTLMYATDTYRHDKGQIIDIEAKDYVSLGTDHRKLLSGVRASVVYPFTPIKDSPYRLGYQAARMGGLIPRRIRVNTKAVRAGFILGCIDARRTNVLRRRYDERAVELNITETRTDDPEWDKLRVRSGLFTHSISHDSIGIMVGSHQPLGHELLRLAGSLGIYGRYNPKLGRVVLNSPYPGVSLRRILLLCATSQIVHRSRQPDHPFSAERTISMHQTPVTAHEHVNFDTVDKTNITEFVKQFCSHNTVIRFPIGIKSVKYIGEGKYHGIVIDRNHRYLLGSYTVTHNTVLMMYMMSKIKYKTIVFISTSPNVLIPQWINSAQKFTDAKAVALKPGMKHRKIRELVDSHQIIVMNIANASKFSDDIFSKFGCVIVDECHAAVTPSRLSALHRVSPRYLLTLTGTMDRSDGMYNLLWLFVSQPPIVRELNAQFNVFKLPTSIVPNYTLNHRGKPDWNSVLNDLAEHDRRNYVISRLISVLRHVHKRHVIVLSKRKSQVHMMRHILKTEFDYPKEDVEILIGSQKFYNGEAGVLLSTYSKTGVGFDHPKLDTLIIATDVSEQIEQYVGRIFRKASPTHIPWVFDMVDKMSSLERHWNERSHWYTEHGATIITPRVWKKQYPEFDFLTQL